MKRSIKREPQGRSVEIPDVLERALAQNPDVAAVFERYSYSHQKEYVDWITEAKKPETRARRAQKAVEMIRSEMTLKE